MKSLSLYQTFNDEGEENYGAFKHTICSKENKVGLIKSELVCEYKNGSLIVSFDKLGGDLFSPRDGN
jgi:hypothetical protein